MDSLRPLPRSLFLGPLSLGAPPLPFPLLAYPVNNAPSRCEAEKTVWAEGSPAPLPLFIRSPGA